MERILRITGKGEGACPPDTIIVTLTTSGEDKNYDKAMQLADKATLNLKEKLVKEAGIEEKKIITTDFRVRAVNKYVKKMSENKYVFDRYEVCHDLTIKFEFNTKKLAKCVDVIVDSMSEPVFNIDFTVENSEEMKKQALTMAVNDAKSKAELLAESAGVKLGDIVGIDHSFSEINIYRPQRMRMDYAYEGAIMSKASASASMESINVQDIKVNANVTIQWGIE